MRIVLYSSESPERCRRTDFMKAEIVPTFWMTVKDKAKPAAAAEEIWRCDSIADGIEGARIAVERNPVIFACGYQLSAILKPEDIPWLKSVKCFHKVDGALVETATPPFL